MNIAGLTIEIWEMVLIVFLFLTIGYVSVNLNDSDFIKAQVLSSEIKYIGYLSENTNVETNLKFDKSTTIEINKNNNYVVKVNNKISSKEIPNNLISLKQDGSDLVIISN